MKIKSMATKNRTTGYKVKAAVKAWSPIIILVAAYVLVGLVE